MSTTVVTETVTTTSAVGAALKPWQYSLCSCCNNGCCDCLGKVCCMTCQYGRALELAFNESCCLCCLAFSLFGLGHILSCCKRQQVRAKYELRGTGCEDCLLCTFCPLCHYQQIIHEIEFREGQVIACCGDVQGNMTGDYTTSSTTTTVTTTTMER